MTSVPDRTVRTVLGDIAPADLGVCDSHDHLFIRSPHLPGDPLDDAGAAGDELRAYASLGGTAVAQWTPIGMGRRADALPALSRSSGVHIIAATGLHQAVHYDRDALGPLMDGLAERFVAELTDGARPDGDPDGEALPARAGMIKVAGGFHGFDAHTRHTFAAAARAHHATGAPIGVHLEGGTSALDVVGLLCATHGVPPHRVILGHLNRAPDTRTHRRAAETGVFLAFDGPSRTHHATDWRLFDCLAALVEAGHADRILIGGDTTSAAARAATGGGPGMPFVLSGLRTRIDRDLGADVAARFLEGNPAEAFAVAWPGGPGPVGGHSGR